MRWSEGREGTGTSSRASDAPARSDARRRNRLTSVALCGRSDDERDVHQKFTIGISY